MLITVVIYMVSCSSSTIGYSQSHGKKLHYYGTADEMRFVMFTNIDEALPKSEEGNSEYLSLTGFLRTDGYLPIEYRSNGRTLTICGKNYALDAGRIFLVDARPNQSSPVVTQIKLSPEEEAAFLEQWQLSKTDSVQALAADPRIKQFLDDSKSSSTKP